MKTEPLTTALPWIVTQPDAGTLDICHEAGGVRSRIARLHCELLAPEHGGSIAANAELICRAANNHAELVQRLRHVLYDIEHRDEMGGNDWICQANEIRAVIAAATSVQPTATPGSAAGVAAKGGAGAE